MGGKTERKEIKVAFPSPGQLQRHNQKLLESCPPHWFLITRQLVRVLSERVNVVALSHTHPRLN